MSPSYFLACSPADITVGGWLILVGTEGGLGAAFFIAAAVPAEANVDAIIVDVTGSHIIIKVAEHYTLLYNNCQVKKQKTIPR